MASPQLIAALNAATSIEDVYKARAADWDAWVAEESAAAEADGRAVAARALGAEADPPCPAQDRTCLEADGTWAVSYDRPEVYAASRRFAVPSQDVEVIPRGAVEAAN